MGDVERFLSVGEAASFLSVSKHFLYKHTKELPHYKAGAKLLYRASELAAILEARRDATKHSAGGQP